MRVRPLLEIVYLVSIIIFYIWNDIFINLNLGIYSGIFDVPYNMA